VVADPDRRGPAAVGLADYLHPEQRPGAVSLSAVLSGFRNLRSLRTGKARKIAPDDEEKEVNQMLCIVIV